MNPSSALGRPGRRFIVALFACVVTAQVGCGPGGPPAEYFFFPLEEGTSVEAELTGVAASDGATIAMKLGETLLEQAGDRALIGMAVEGLHTHPEWIATVPGGAPPEDFTLSLSFRLTGAEPHYAASGAYRLGFALLETVPEEPEETEIFLGSTLDGEGQLVAQYEFETVVPLYFDQCLGGTEPDCAGGVRLYSATNPGFAPKE